MRMNVEKEGKNTMGKSREKYHMVYGIVPYGIGIVPYGTGSQGGKTACLCEEEACLLHSISYNYSFYSKAVLKG